MELFVALITLLVSLFFTVEVGLLAGICTNIVHLALMWSRPKLKIELIEVSVCHKYIIRGQSDVDCLLRKRKGGLVFGRLMSLERIRRITPVCRLIRDVATMLLLIYLLESDNLSQKFLDSSF